MLSGKMFSYFLSGNIGLKLDLATPTARTPLYNIRGLSSWQLQKVLPSPICLFGWTLSDFWEICKDYFLFFYELVVLSKTETWSNRDCTQSVLTEPTFSVRNMHVLGEKKGWSLEDLNMVPSESKCMFFVLDSNHISCTVHGTPFLVLQKTRMF